MAIAAKARAVPRHLTAVLIVATSSPLAMSTWQRRSRALVCAPKLPCRRRLCAACPSCYGCVQPFLRAIVCTALGVGGAAISHFGPPPCWLYTLECSIALSGVVDCAGSSTDELRTVVLSSSMYVLVNYCAFGLRSSWS